MSTATETKDVVEPAGPKPEQAPKVADPVLGVTRYDRVVSLLLTLLMIIGMGAAVFGVIWASNKQWISRRPPPKIDVVDFIEDVEGGGTEDGVLGESLFAPGPEAPDVSTAATPDDVTADTPVEQQITSLMNAVGAATAMSDELMMSSDIGSSVLPGGNPKGKGKHRNLGKGPGDGGGVKRQERWEISFDAGQTEIEYARQLDFFRVELGAIVDKQIHYASNLASPRPTVKVAGGGPDDKRLYFSWRAGGRRQSDIKLLQKAGVPLTGSVVVLQFYPTETEQALARLEVDYAGKSGKAMHEGKVDMRKVRKTKFNVVKKAGGYGFEVARQEYFGEMAGK